MPRYCKAIDCTKRSSYGLPDDKTATYCKKHALEGMIDIKNKRCKAIDCTTRPSYGLPDDKKATYCKSHALEGMIDIVSKRCLDPDCTTKPSYGLPDDKKATYCKSHASDDMIDIKHKRCLDPDCTKNPVYGLPDDKRATYCKSHALEGMINIVNKLCETCNSTRINPKYNPNCSRCHFYLNPNDPRIRNYKTKEHAYMTAILEKFPQFKLDKTINGGCSKRRPDGFLDLLTHVIIIEIDENEHKSYDDTCNNRRTMELSQDVGHRPIVFIRLNPDGYTLDGKRMKGSFSLTKKTGELKVVKKEFNKRLNLLIESVDHHINTIPDKIISVEYLYFTE